MLKAAERYHHVVRAQIEPPHGRRLMAGQDIYLYCLSNYYDAIVFIQYSLAVVTCEDGEAQACWNLGRGSSWKTRCQRLGEFQSGHVAAMHDLLWATLVSDESGLLAGGLLPSARIVGAAPMSNQNKCLNSMTKAFCTYKTHTTASVHNAPFR